MKKSKFTEKQITYALCQAEAGTSVVEICCKMGVTEQSFYRWKRKYASIGVAELRCLKELEKAKKKLKQLVADFFWTSISFRRF